MGDRIKSKVKKQDSKKDSETCKMTISNESNDMNMNDNNEKNLKENARGIIMNKLKKIGLIITDEIKMNNCIQEKSIESAKQMIVNKIKKIRNREEKEETFELISKNDETVRRNRSDEYK